MDNTKLQLELLKKKESFQKDINKFKIVIAKIEKLESELALKLKTNYEFLNMMQTTYNESMDNYHDITKNLL